MDLKDYPSKLFTKELPLIVVGTEAPTSDILGSIDIVSKFKDEFPQNSLHNKDIAKLDIDVESIHNKNIISIGSPFYNKITAKLLGYEDKISYDEWVKLNISPGKAIMKLVSTGEKTVGIAIYGYSSFEIQATCNVLANYEEFDLEGDEIEVIVTEKKDNKEEYNLDEEFEIQINGITFKTNDAKNEPLREDLISELEEVLKITPPYNILIICLKEIITCYKTRSFLACVVLSGALIEKTLRTWLEEELLTENLNRDQILTKYLVKKAEFSNLIDIWYGINPNPEKRSHIKRVLELRNKYAHIDTDIHDIPGYTKIMESKEEMVIYSDKYRKIAAEYCLEQLRYFIRD